MGMPTICSHSTFDNESLKTGRKNGVYRNGGGNPKPDNYTIILSEISPEYVQLAQKRINPYLNQKTLF